jgi:uncharacterized membrane protein YphA (DoxX/SURF4 family)
MSLLRAASRTLLASYFVASGVKAVREPEALVPVAEPLTDRLVPTVKQYAPQAVVDYVPADPKTLVRINGAAQIVGGVALATGVGRRLGALILAATLIPSTLAKYPFWTRQIEDERASDRNQFLKNASLLGGVLLAAQDTEGKPSLAWRAQKGTQSLAKGTQSLAKDTRKASTRVARSTSALTDAALAEGAVLVGAVVKQSRRARKKAVKRAETARKAAQQAAKQAKKRAAATAEASRKQIEAAQKQAAKRAADAKKQAKQLASNIRLGEN